MLRCDGVSRIPVCDRLAAPGGPCPPGDPGGPADVQQQIKS